MLVNNKTNNFSKQITFFIKFLICKTNTCNPRHPLLARQDTPETVKPK